MFQGFTDATVDFMWNLRFNNEKTWFAAHKEEYKALLERPMQELGREVSGRFAESRPELRLRLHISRIYRDARRLHGKGPFKDHLWFSLRQDSEDWTRAPVFWFELTPETWSYGLGYYAAKALTMRKLRARIEARPESLVKLDLALARQREFMLDGENYARNKREPGELLATWYNKKNLSLIHEEKVGEAVFSRELDERIVQGFTFLLPYYQYFISLEADPTPGETREKA